MVFVVHWIILHHKIVFIPTHSLHLNPGLWFLRPQNKNNIQHIQRLKSCSACTFLQRGTLFRAVKQKQLGMFLYTNLIGKRFLVDTLIVSIWKFDFLRVMAFTRFSENLSHDLALEIKVTYSISSKIFSTYLWHQFEYPTLLCSQVISFTNLGVHICPLVSTGTSVARCLLLRLSVAH